MVNYYQIILIAISLSLDAFSISISIESNKFNFASKILFIIIVGICHFIFPILGIILGKSFLTTLAINGQKILGFVLLLLSFEMLYEIFCKKETIKQSVITILIMAFSVSIDSFLTGIGLYTYNKLFIISITFSIFSMIFSILGLFFGRFLKKINSNISSFVGVIMLFLLGVKFVFFD